MSEETLVNLKLPDPAAMKIPWSRLRPRPSPRLTIALGMAVAAMASCGCARVPVAAQRLVSKPNMVFGDSFVFTDARRLVAQVEPGSAFSGGAQAAGCTACK